MPRTATIHRQTAETTIDLSLNLDGTGQAQINTGVGFFDHMLTLLAKHSLIDLTVTAKGDLHVDRSIGRILRPHQKSVNETPRKTADNRRNQRDLSTSVSIRGRAR